jgi:hypothetical protein
MARSLALVIMALACWLSAGATAIALDGGRYGDVKLALPPNTPRGYVVFFSDSGGSDRKGWRSRSRRRHGLIP